VTPSHLQSTLNEYIQASASRNHAASLGDFADKPLGVLTAGSGSNAAWFAFQKDLASLSTNSVHRVIDSATHAELVSDEDAAAATSQAILDVVSAVRSGGPVGR
jgi:hypothetical protein